MNDVNFSECKFDGEMVAYMYGELSSNEASAFERHLVECSACTDEFAAISSSRYEVYDWKQLEFDPLETPIFEIPREVTAGVSWSDRIRAVFARGWTVPTVSFAALAIISVAVAGLIWRQDNNLENLSTNVGPETAILPMVDESPVPGVRSVPPGNVVPVYPTTARARQSKAIPKSGDAQPVKATRVRPVEVKQTTARNEQRVVPNLSEYSDDDEDTSLRLAELLDDIGSR